ncbi:MAG: alpha-amylase/4-alpha-glucanotransferase domain-containing protein [Thermodesulfobacteriota bacterium]
MIIPASSFMNATSNMLLLFLIPVDFVLKFGFERVFNPFMSIGNPHAPLTQKLYLHRRCNLWRFPIETVSLSESGFERIFQGSCLLFYWPLDLEPEKRFEVGIELAIGSL